MIGRIVVLEPVQYQQWLSGTNVTVGASGEPMERRGETLFAELRRTTRHEPELAGVTLGPPLAGLFGKPVQLQNGESVIADEEYLRESVLNPHAKLVAGYQALMPTYQGQVSEDGLLQLIAYIRSLGENGELRAER